MMRRKKSKGRSVRHAELSGSRQRRLWRKQDEDVKRQVGDAFRRKKMHLGLLLLDQMPTKEFRSAWGQISDRLNDNDLCITLTELQARL